MSKTKAAPIKQPTLPRLELFAAQLGAKLSCYISKNIQPSQIILWSESKITLSWISVISILLYLTIEVFLARSDWFPKKWISRICSPPYCILTLENVVIQKFMIDTFKLSLAVLVSTLNLDVVLNWFYTCRIPQHKRTDFKGRDARHFRCSQLTLWICQNPVVLSRLSRRPNTFNRMLSCPCRVPSISRGWETMCGTLFEKLHPTNWEP